ncbi:sensor histidine kinase [Pontibacter sp. SGAir0037]|uniref:sensor histidine kinase n=1 Tax=Pontibacter sp. SGAir0037 TaxID=2571030 RepID=UPI0010CD2819|nr:sensor histidine kinase [Pontibacter sp. SGAir0037]QCR21273.1 two-component sensor histidine kinase [Pontibacter sp. SGAir0037]
MKLVLPVISVSAILFLLAIGIVVFVLRYQKRLILHHQHISDLQRAKQKQLLEAALEAQEDERRRLARDLHDDVGAMLALVKLHVGQLCAEVKDSPEALAKGQMIKGLLDEVIGSARRISHDLMPAILEKFGLVQAVESIRRAIPQHAGITFEFVHAGEKKLQPKVELAIFRVLQELLNNTLKHSEATLIRVELVYLVDMLRVLYTDNGKGFDYQAQISAIQAAKPGLGLTNLQGRIEIIDGTFDFFSTKGGGVRVSIVVPIAYL